MTTTAGISNEDFKNDPEVGVELEFVSENETSNLRNRGSLENNFETCGKKEKDTQKVSGKLEVLLLVVVMPTEQPMMKQNFGPKTKPLARKNLLKFLLGSKQKLLKNHRVHQNNCFFQKLQFCQDTRSKQRS